MDTDDHKQRKLAELEETIQKQDEDHEARMRQIEETTMNADHLDTADADRLALLDRLGDRVPELDLDQHEVEWTRMPDGAEALVVDGGGFDGGNGYYVANYGDDLHVIGTTAPLIPGKIGCVLIHDDGSRELARLIPDPLADWRGDDDESRPLRS